jgi:hypothetical protein
VDQIPDAALHGKRRDSTVACLFLGLTQNGADHGLIVVHDGGRPGLCFFRGISFFLTTSMSVASSVAG